MSDQHDTSRTPTTNKNPLLSASVTGLTFDDFTNKAIILPAAALPPKLPEPKDTEPTKPVIFGTEPAILDTESFSEISLDQPSDQESYPPSANPLQDDQFNTDYSKTFNPLTQATHLTASLSQLPSVASSVFSSFSSILRGASPTPTSNTFNDQQQIDAYNAPSVQTVGNVPLVNSSLSYQSVEPEVPAVVPTFYSTSDPAFLPPAPALSPPPSNTTSGNAYRLTTKRKTYAPAPGLTHQDNQTAPSGFPSQAPPLPQPIIEPNIQVNQSAAYQNTAVNQPTTQNNKFSLTSFFATPLLEKITGASGGHTQGTHIPDDFTVQSTNPPVVPAVNPGLFDTHQVQENIPNYSAEQLTFQPTPSVVENIPTYSAQQQTFQSAPSSSTALFFNPAQQTNLPTAHQSQSSGTELISNISSIPPSTIPPSGNVSSYRLRGKPHYKNPLSSTFTATPAVLPFPQATSIPAPPVGIFNPVNFNISPEQQPIGSTVNPSQSTYPSGFSQQSPPNVAFFNQQSQSVSAEPNPLNFNQFNSGNPIATFNTLGRENVPPIQLSQQVQPVQEQHFQLPNEPQPLQQQLFQPQSFQLPNEPQQNQSQPIQQQTFLFQESQLDSVQQGQLQSVENRSVQDIDREQQPESIQYPVASSNQAQLLPSDPPSHQPTQLQPNLFQQFEPVKESNQLFQLQPTQIELTAGQSGTDQQVTPLQPQFFVNPFAVPTANVEQPSNFASDIFTQSQLQNQKSNFYQPQTFSSVTAESNLHSHQEVSNVSQTTFQNQYTEEIYENTQAQLTNLSLNKEETNLFDPPQLQQDNTTAENLSQQSDTVVTERKTSSTFDNFFNRPASQQSASSTYPEPPPPETIATSTLASSFFATTSNSSPNDWFNSSKTSEPSTTQFPDDINRNTQALPPVAQTLDANNFFATTNTNTNNNQTSSPPNYFQIQNFFNNPPLIADSKEQDNNFNFIENNLINKRLHNLTHKASTETDGGSISSNIVEPPSSAQSEFSEFAEVNPETAQSDEFLGEPQFPVDSPNNTNIMANTTDQSNGNATEISNVVYRPVYKHWFYNKKSSDQKPTWTPFPMNDSLNLEEAFTSNSNQCITTNGGRYDVNIETRTRSPIYWNGTADEVRRCSWFYKGADSRLVPYEEGVADLLEEEYRLTSQSGEWNRKIVIPSGEVVMFQAPSVMVHFLAAQSPELWPNASVPPTANRPRVVKRGVDEFNIEDGEPEQINHLLFMVHGIGAGCDIKFRSVEEVVEDFRAIALQLTQSHYRSSCDRGEVGRIEVLPVSWHTELHSEESGIDEKLKAITLESIPKMRTFTNDTLLDILFYSSPVFCQKIMDTVAGTINKMYIKYCERNPNFKGNVSLAGHSLGSLILFDLLQNQRDPHCSDNQMDVDCSTVAETKEDVAGVRSHMPLSRTRSRRINYTIGPAGTGQPYINYPQLVFHPKKFFALGSPIGMFVTVRGIDTLGLNYKLPTTDGFYNIFHPYDPVAYRIEALVNSDLIPIRPVLIPHHKGRKRMHLELRETMARVGADIKQKIIDTFKSVYNFASLQKNDPKALQQEVDKVLEQQLSLETSQPQRTRAFSTSTTSSDDNGDIEFSLGMLNEGKRIDYVLQEAPLEFFNEYLFALTSHVCYWDSADTILFIVKEIYTSLGMQTDSQIPQQSMTIERPISTPTSPTPTDS